MDFLRNAAGLIIFVGIFMPLLGYFPITFLIAWRQAANAQSWETTKCVAQCWVKSSSGRRGKIHYTYGVNFGFKSRLEKPELPLVVEFPNTKRPPRDPKHSAAERVRQIREYDRISSAERAEIEKRSREREEQYARQKKINESEEKKFTREQQPFSVFQIAGLNYWGGFGMGDVCRGRWDNEKEPRFETDCYLDPNNPERAVLIRDLRLDWFHLILLILNSLLLIGFIILSYKIFFDAKTNRKPSLSFLRK